MLYERWKVKPLPSNARMRHPTRDCISSTPTWERNKRIPFDRGDTQEHGNWSCPHMTIGQFWSTSNGEIISFPGTPMSLATCLTPVIAVGQRTSKIMLYCERWGRLSTSIMMNCVCLCVDVCVCGGGGGGYKLCTMTT